MFMSTIYRPIVIISAERYNLTKAENQDRTAKLRSTLNDLGLSYIEGTGCYQGTEEVSFIVAVPPGTDHLSKCIDLRDMFNQECILYRDHYNDTHLIYADRTEKIGRLVATPEADAKKAIAWTYNPAVDCYFTVVSAK